MRSCFILVLLAALGAVARLGAVDAPAPGADPATAARSGDGGANGADTDLDSPDNGAEAGPADAADLSGTADSDSDKAGAGGDDEADAGGDSPTAADTAAHASALASYQKGLALERQKYWTQALGAYQAALAADADLDLAEREEGLCFYQLGWKDQALEHLQAYLDSGADDPPIRGFTDRLLDEEERLEAASARAASDGAGPWGLQGELGYGWGLTSSSFGHRFNRTGNSNPFVYDYPVGQGFAYTLEAVYSINDGLALGISLSPVDLNSSAGSSNTDAAGVTTVDSTQVTGLTLPVLLNVHTRTRLARALRLECFAGVGGVFNQPYVETSTDSIEGAAGKVATQSVRYQRDVAPDLAFRGGLSLSWILSARCSAFLRGSLLLAHDPAESVLYSSTVTNSKGVVTATYSDSNTYEVEPPPTQSVAAPAVPSTIPASSTAQVKTYTYDDGPTQWTDVVTYDKSGAQTDAVFTETNALNSTTNSDIVNTKVLAATAGLEWEF